MLFCILILYIICIITIPFHVLKVHISQIKVTIQKYDSILRKLFVLYFFFSFSWRDLVFYQDLILHYKKIRKNKIFFFYSLFINITWMVKSLYLPKQKFNSFFKMLYKIGLKKKYTVYCYGINIVWNKYKD